MVQPEQTGFARDVVTLVYTNRVSKAFNLKAYVLSCITNGDLESAPQVRQHVCEQGLTIGKYEAIIHLQCDDDAVFTVAVELAPFAAKDAMVSSQGHQIEFLQEVGEADVPTPACLL